ncbi:unnamed protein product [Mytilus coruscus]|uniref:CCHC-type domain-containing protein n=1 Tax=Mytilus coruscus TaxID=42192 RepID=A0A6J8BIT7_MYTCO|nr:unnamed protein product [Mytilus coruscus]
MSKKLYHMHKEKGENLQLKQQLEHNNKIIEQLQKSTKTVYVAKERPFTKLSGRPTKDRDPMISDWLEDSREHLVTIPDEKAKIDCLMQNLISPAKDEIRLRPLLERDSADNSLLLIHSIYGGDGSVSQLQQLFFQRNQKDDETLQDYSWNLMKIFDQINKRDNTVLGDKDKVLKNRFIEGIKEPHLKREVKRFSYEHKTMKFLEFRQEVLIWVNENTKSWKVKLQMQDVEDVSNQAIKSENTLKDNSEILKLLTKQLEIHKPIICYNCGGKGHKRPECPSPFQAQRRDEDTQKTHTRGQFRGRGRGYRGRYNQRGNRYQGRGTVVPSDSEEVKDKSPETEIVVENQSVIALIDTDSQVSTVTGTYFNTLLEKKPILHDITRWMKVTRANDLPIPYFGYIELNISVAKTMIPNVDFLVVKDTDNISKSELPFLLGSNFFMKMKETLEVYSETEKNTLIGKQLSSILTLYNNSFDCETDSPKISFVKIAGSIPVHIPGNSMKTVMCTTRQKDKTEKYCAVVQSLQGNQGSLPRNIMVINSYAEISQGTVPVRMINIELEDVWINQKIRAGTLYSASLIHEVSQNNIDIDIDQTQINVQIKKIDAAVCKQDTTNIENNKAIQLNDLDIDKENLTHEQIEKVKDLLNKNTDIFCTIELDLGYTDIVKHRILTTDEKLIAITYRRIPPNQMEEVRAHIKQLLNQNIIQYTTDEIRQLQSSDNVLSVVLNFVEQGKLTTQLLTKQTKPVKKLLRKFEALLIDNGILYRKISDIECGDSCKPLDILAMDFTVLEKSSDGRENVLVLTDVFTKFTQAIPTRDQKATTVAKVLVKDWFLKLGIPQ